MGLWLWREIKTFTRDVVIGLAKNRQIVGVALGDVLGKVRAEL